MTKNFGSDSSPDTKYAPSAATSDALPDALFHQVEIRIRLEKYTGGGWREQASDTTRGPNAWDALASQKMDLKQRINVAMQSNLDIVQNDRKLLGVVFRYSGEPCH